MKWLIDRVGRRGLTLLFLAYLDVIIALGIHSVSNTRLAQGAYTGPLAVAPLDLWAGIWLATAILCFVQAFMRRDRAAFIAAASIKMGWAASYLIAWLVLGQDFAWQGASVWAAFGALVLLIAGWEENHAHPDLSVELEPTGPHIDIEVAARMGLDTRGSLDSAVGGARVLPIDAGEQGAGGDEAAP